MERLFTTLVVGLMVMVVGYFALNLFTDTVAPVFAQVNDALTIR